MKIQKLDRLHIVPFTNPSGAVVHRVYGRLESGKVIRENFKDLPSALARKQELEIAELNAPLVLTMQPTRLSTSQLRDAEAACQRLNGTSHTLVNAVEYLLKNFRPESLEIRVKEAYPKFLADKHAQNLRERTLGDLKARVGKFATTHGEKCVSGIGLEEIESALQRADISPATFNGDRRSLHSFFEWCLRHEYCRSSPVARIAPAKVERAEPVILPLSEIKDFLVAASDHKNGVVMPYLALALFGGMRPNELERISWDDVDLDEKLVTIRGAAAKPRERRLVDLTDKAVDWLRAHHGETPIVGPNFRRDFDAVRRLSGYKGGVYPKKCDAMLKAWPSDVLRHSAISYWQAEFKDEGACAERHGTSVEVIHRHYRGLVKPRDAEAFWQLSPQGLQAEMKARRAA